MAPCRRLTLVSVVLALASAAPARAQEIVLEDFGSFGGWANTVFPTPDRVFIGQTNRMLVAEWSGDALVTRGSIEFDDEPTALFASGNRAYAVYGNGFQVVDISDPDNPGLVGSNTFLADATPVRRIWVSDGYAYVAQDSPVGASSFWILNAPGTGGGLTVVGSLDVGGAEDVRVSGTTAFLVAGTNQAGQSGLYAYDVSNRAAPTRVSSLLVSGATRLDVESGIAYVVGGGNRGVTVVDVTDPAAPVLLSQFENGSSSFRQVDAHGSMLYLLDTSGALRIVDVANPAAPVPVATVPSGSVWGWGSAVAAVNHTVGGTRVYATISGEVMIVDATVPAAPVTLEAFHEPGEVRDTGESPDLFAVVDGSSIWLYSNESETPTFRSKIAFSGSNNVTIDGDLLVAADWTATVRLYDVSNPAAPTLVGQYTTPSAVVEMRTRGDLLYLLTTTVAGGNARLQTLDLANPASPTRIGEVAVNGNGIDLWVPPADDPLHAGRVAVAHYSSGSGTGGFTLLDASNPALLVPISTWSGSGVKPVAIELSGKRAVTASMDAAETHWYVDVFDLSNPAAPVGVEGYDAAGSAVWDLLMLSATTVALALPDEDAVLLITLVTAASKDDALEPAGRRAAKKARRLAKLRRRRNTENKDNLYAAGGYASYGYPELSGSNGATRYRYTTPEEEGGGQVTLVTHVAPNEAAADGSTVVPGGSTTYQPGAHVTLSATAATGWVFTGWSGSLSGSTNPENLVMDSDKDVTGNFLPTLVLSMPAVTEMLGCPPVIGTEWTIANASLTALGTDWLATAIEFAVPADVSGEAVRIREAVLIVRGQRIVGAVTTRPPLGDLASVSFTLPGVVIAEGEVLTMQLRYVLQFEDRDANGPCALDRLHRYRVSTNVSKVTALPVPESARPGIKLPQGQDFVSPLHVVGCAWNEARDFVAGTIQEAIDDVRTVLGDAVKVCPGTYAEAVTVSKTIRLASYEGPARTEIRPAAGKAAPGVGIHVTADGAMIEGFFVTGAQEGIRIDDAADVQVGGADDDALTRNIVSGNDTGIVVQGQGSERVRIFGNYIGTNRTGMSALPNAGAGVFVKGGKEVRVGWQSGSNLISGNGLDGIQVENAESTGIFYNRIGLNETGSAALPNGTALLGVGGVALVSGTKTHVSANVISGNRGFGLYIGPDAWSNTVDDNRIGVDDEAETAIPNTLDGIYVRSSYNVIGTDAIDQPNVIAGNGRHGILIEGTEAEYNYVRFNFIGTNPDTLETVGNEGDGVRIKDASNNRIGPKNRRTGPVIAFNAGRGVAIEGEESVGNAIRKTEFIENGLLGIDLGVDNVTANDLSDDPSIEDDDDVGPNWRMNYPVGVIATPKPRAAETLELSGYLDAEDVANTAVDLFMSALPDTSGAGEGWHYLDTATPGADGFFRIELAKAALKYPYLSATATALDDSSTSEFSWVCLDTDGDGVIDSDGDGLCDNWEVSGIDYDGDRQVDLPIHDAAFGAKQDRKDLFVEIDWMLKPGKSLQPVQGALDDVVGAFAGATTVANPDGTTGITLHLMADEAVPWQDQVTFAGTGAGTYHGIKHGNPVDPCGDDAAAGHFGTAADRASDQCPRILGARKLAFRYTLFANKYGESPGSSGIAELPGNDFIVSLGSWGDADLKWGGGYAATAGNGVLPTARRRVESGTLMHEFGHTLNLGHGGEDHSNCKPNYLSIMSYSLQLHSGIPGRVLDYSSYDLGDLNEQHLDERVGIGGPAQRRNLYNRSAAASTSGSRRTFTANAVNINWNGLDSDGDGTAGNDPDVTADLNYLPNEGCPTGGLTTLTTQNDWQNLAYDFRSGSSVGSGAPLIGAEGEAPEITSDNVRAMVLSVDFDEDGFVNGLDNCPQIANPTQQDLDGDGIGDVCEARASDLQLYMQPSTDTPRAGTPFEYLLTVHNAGPDSTEAVFVADTLDARYSIEAVTPSSGSCDVGNRSFSCDLGGLATFGMLTVSLRVNAIEAGILANEAWVSSMELDPDTTSNRVRLAPSVASGVNNERSPDVPDRFDLLAPYPNPFSVASVVPFDVAADSRVRLVVYDVLGREMARPVDGPLPAGRHQAMLDGARWAPGVYLVRITMGGYVETAKLVLVR